ncbi:chromosome segregation protein [Carpediemonas membranifera]|uniref:Chromosome segregation protein n=1 Tax=Carpediemonas membranifera TaxID=201153 RepID=A0A8J6E4F6_9EUKA|nr:chromosome segregation protein [Carpediemonas membranifera]|eukprot:KAG9397133.1 chromosome segregation protein [Carpediemonas membranifera]
MFSRKSKKDKKTTGKKGSKVETRPPFVSNVGSFRAPIAEEEYSVTSISPPESRAATVMGNNTMPEGMPPSVEEGAEDFPDLDLAEEFMTLKEDFDALSDEHVQLKTSYTAMEEELQASRAKEAEYQSAMADVESRMAAMIAETQKTVTQAAHGSVSGQEVWAALSSSIPAELAAPLKDQLQQEGSISGEQMLTIIKAVGVENKKLTGQLQAVAKDQESRMTKVKAAVKQRMARYQETIEAQEKVVTKLETYLQKLVTELKEANSTRSDLQKKLQDFEELQKESDRVKTAAHRPAKNEEMTASMLAPSPVASYPPQPTTIAGAGGQPLVIMPPMAPQPQPQYMFMGGPPMYQQSPGVSNELVSSLVEALRGSHSLAGQGEGERARVREDSGRRGQRACVEEVDDGDRHLLETQVERANARAKAAENELMGKVRGYAQEIAELKMRLAERG